MIGIIRIATMFAVLIVVWIACGGAETGRAL
jgi:hypothetical protein